MPTTNKILTTTFSWITADKILPKNKNIPVNQIYCWVITRDNKLILVSKDGKKWQFPGGHPEPGETMIETCKRELFEETGLKIDGMEQKLVFFGYYHVIEPNDAKTALRDILQLRYLLKLEIKSNNLNLKPQEKTTEPEHKKINQTKAFGLNQVVQLVPWLKKSEEYQRFKEVSGVN